MSLPPELLSKIVLHLGGDTRTLYCCALVSGAIHHAATSLLYKEIYISPPRSGIAWQVAEATIGRKPFASAQLPTHVAHVQEFTLTGYITTIRPSREIPTPIIYRIPDAMRMWKNLRRIKIAPEKSTLGTALVKIVEALRDCHSLRELVVNQFAMAPIDAMRSLAMVAGLEEISLINPTRSVFLVLRHWLGNNQDTIDCMKLTGDCGSLTPGILREIVPYISKIRFLQIGISYSLTNADVFACLSQFSRLQRLRITYYYQHGTLPPGPKLPALQELTVLHSTLFSKEDAGALSAWIRRVTSSSPLEVLETISYGAPGPKLCFDGLISHIGSRHQARLRYLIMPTAYVREPTLRSLLCKCRELRFISLAIAFSTFRAFTTMTSAISHLQIVTFDVCDRPNLVLGKEDVMKVMESTPQLNYITIGGLTFKGSWAMQQDEEGSVKREFIVTANVTQDKQLHEPNVLSL